MYHYDTNSANNGDCHKKAIPEKNKQTMYKIANFISGLIGVRGDYILHFGVCNLSTSIIGILSFLVVNHFLGYTPALIASLFGAVFALGLSIGKESGDIPNSGWSWWDLVADGLGIAVGILIIGGLVW